MIGSRLIFRKWGWYLVLLDRRYFKVKLLRFTGKHSLSKQYHNLRNELWLYLSGPNEGNWTVYPSGIEHVYNERAYVLEVQYGSKCIEEDIVRI